VEDHSPLEERALMAFFGAVPSTGLSTGGGVRTEGRRDVVPSPRCRSQ
jgi:hypothetical protein